jgi:hypothetical protein
MKKLKRFWISRNQGVGSSQYITLWNKKPCKVKNLSSERYWFEPAKENNNSYKSIMSFDTNEFNSLFGKCLAEGECCQVSFSMEVFI